jgi:small multidrug resistance family-3 protein
VFAGLCEIGGGHLVWLSVREGKPIDYALAGSAILILYGILPTLQPASFARVYAACGGMVMDLAKARDLRGEKLVIRYTPWPE